MHFMYCQFWLHFQLLISFLSFQSLKKTNIHFVNLNQWQVLPYSSIYCISKHNIKQHAYILEVSQLQQTHFYKLTEQNLVTNDWRFRPPIPPNKDSSNSAQNRTPNKWPGLQTNHKPRPKCPKGLPSSWGKDLRAIWVRMVSTFIHRQSIMILWVGL